MFFTRFVQAAVSLSALAAALPAAGGKPRTYELTLTVERGAPDGFERDMIMVNGQFPAPKLEFNQGDHAEIIIHNQLPWNTSIHYHGLDMIDTPWSDGVPGLTQRHIAPGATFKYEWTATQYGAYWYHAHDRGQVDDGLLGPLHIHASHDVERPFAQISDDPKEIAAMLKAEAHSRQLIVGDWRHAATEEIWDITVQSGVESICWDTVLFNGKGKVDCWSAEKIDSLLDPQQEGLLAGANETSFTAKGCLSAEAYAATIGRGRETHVDVIPDSYFDVCTPTEGRHEVIEVKKSKKCDKDHTWVAIDLIGSFGFLSGHFSVDEHEMFLYAVDGGYIDVQTIEALQIMNGNRYSFLVKLTEVGDFTMRFASIMPTQLIAGTATLRYVDESAAPADNEASVAFIDDAGVNTTAEVVFFDERGMKMFPPEAIGESDQTIVLRMRMGEQAYEWALNEQQFSAENVNKEPLLFSAPEIEDGQHFHTLNDTWVDLIFEATTFPMPSHPLHKHGNHMRLLARGQGEFTWASVAEAAAANPDAFNLVDPPKRDTFGSPPAGAGPTWMAVRYHVTNPGPWLMHCHIQSHMISGMSIVLMDGVDAWPTVPDEYLTMA